MRSVVTLLSNLDASHTSSQFSNYLPHRIYPRRGYSCLYVRILDLCVPVPPNTDQVAWIFLSELEGNILVRDELDHCLGQVHLNSQLQNKDGLCYREYKHSSFHRVNQIPLNKLSIRIADHESRNIDSVANRVTSVTLEIMDEIETGEQFEITGLSRTEAENNPFPYNSTNDFTIPLPYEINLGEGWEVALKSITFPAGLVHPDYWVQIQDQDFYIDVSAISSRRQAAALVVETFNRSEFANELEVELGRSRATRGYTLRITRLPHADEERRLSMGFSKAIVKLLNPESVMPDLYISLQPDQKFPLTVGADLDVPILPDYSPIGLIHCDAVACSVVGAELRPLLHTVPLGQFIFSRNVSFYEPENIVYRDTVSRKFSSINIKMLDVKGKKYRVMKRREQDGVIITLKFRRRQNLASYAL